MLKITRMLFLVFLLTLLLVADLVLPRVGSGRTTPSATNPEVASPLVATGPDPRPRLGYTKRDS